MKTLFTRKIPLISILTLFISLGIKAQKEVFISSSSFKVKTLGRGIQSPQTGGNPNAFYSNVTNSQNANYANGGATDDPSRPGNTITTLVADNLTLVGTPPFNVSNLTFTVSNGNSVPVTARPRLRFYQADGANGGPGTLIYFVTFAAYTFAANNAQTISTPITPFQINTQTIWAGITFDNDGGSTGATTAQLNLLGQQLFNPVDRGSSTDLYFKTTNAGSFGSSNPPGSTANFNGNPVANFGWELAPGSTLPIVINYLKGNRNGSDNILEWKIECINTANSTMILQKSIDNKSFQDIYSASATSQQCSQPFKFTDASVAAAVNYYRLKVTDDGRVEKYSDIVAIVNSSNSLEKAFIYPNPIASNSQAFIQLIAAKQGFIYLQIYDIMGKVIHSQNKAIQQGLNKIQINTSTLGAGNYKLRVTDTEGNSTVLSFIKS